MRMIASEVSGGPHEDEDAGRGATGDGRQGAVHPETLQQGSGRCRMRIGNIMRRCLPDLACAGKSRNWSRGRCAAVAIAGVLAVAASLQPAGAQNWPDAPAYYSLRIMKTAGLEMTDTAWGHFHHNDGAAQSFDVQTLIEHLGDPAVVDLAAAQLTVRYTVRGIPISLWLVPPAAFKVEPANNAAFANIPDGISDLSLEVQGLDGPPAHGGTPATRLDFRPLPMFVHIARGQTPADSIPIITQNVQDYRGASGTTYATVVDRNFRGYPANPSVVPWRTFPPYMADLFQEEMQPHTDLFQGAQMWWEEPPGTISAGLKFVRAIAPKAGEYFIGLYDNQSQVAPSTGGFGGHRTFPSKDGPRGVGWTNGYIQGQVDSQGGLVFVNVGGALRYMKPDGELITVAGWRVQPGKDPVWFLKPLNAIRQNMELRGTWVNGQYSDDPGFHQPMDVAVDPRDENVWYVAGLYDNCIWKVVVDKSTWTGTVSVFAGDVNHGAGFVDGQGTAARFWHPFSITFDPVSDRLYVSDHENDAIRQITRDGTVTTLFGHTNLAGRIQAIDPSQVFNDTRLAVAPASYARQYARLAVSADEAAAGLKPDIFFPYTVRVDSLGNLIVFDRGFNTIRRIDPATGVTTVLVTLHDGGFGEWVRGWAWLDVDRWGNAGLKDGIYLAIAVSYTTPNGESDDHFNEEFWAITPDGTQQRWITGPDRDPYPDGWGPILATDPPHYPWLVAVDPRGALYLAGIGEHGITRIRSRRADDPAPSDDMAYLDGKRLWSSGAASPNAYWYTIRPTSTVLPPTPPSLKFGWNAHNYLGFADAWGIGSASDADLIAAFELPASITGSYSAVQATLNFIRLNSGSVQPGTGGAVPPLPPSNLTVR